MTLKLIDEAVAAGAGLERACEIVGLSARCVARWRAAGSKEDQRRGPNTPPPQKLTAAEREVVLRTANEPRFRDLSPKQIVPLLADEGQYVGSESTFYRLLHQAGQMAHRGATRPPQRRPRREHIATGPKQLWSWDITYLRSSLRGRFYYLYVVVDVWSRKIVGTAVHEEECAEHAAVLLNRAYATEGVKAGSLVLHADNGGLMKGATLLATLQRLGIAASYSRPGVSDDNAYSEALFRTLKFRPDFPKRPFRSLEEAHGWVDRFVRWYNSAHLHSALRFVTPDDRHAGRDARILTHRAQVYARSRSRFPLRWSGPFGTGYPSERSRSTPSDTVRAQSISREVR